MADLFTKVSQIKTRTKVLIVFPVLLFTLMLSINKAPLQLEFIKRLFTEVTVPQATVPSPELSKTAPTSIVKSSPKVGQEVSSLQQQESAKTPVPRAQPTPTPFVVLPGKFVGNFSLGMTKEEVLKITPKPQENTPQRLVYRSKKTGSVLRAHFEKNRLVQIDFTSKDFSTEAGIHTGNFRDEQYKALFDVQTLPGTSLRLKYTLKTGGLTFYSVSDPLPRAFGVVHAGHEPLYDMQRIALDTQEQVQGALPQRIDGLLPEDIPLVRKGGVYEIPVEINGVLTLNFVLDTGASEVNIPADVALTLYRSGTIKDADFLPGQTYRLADGSQVNSSRFVLRSLKVGQRRITNVAASIGNISSSLLLGQSFLGKLGTWGIDSQKKVLAIGASPYKFGWLMNWVGKYPVDCEDLDRERCPSSKKLFEIPQIRQPLEKLLKKDDFERLNPMRWVTTPIELIADYVVVKMCRPHFCLNEEVILAVNLQSGSIYIGFWKEYGAIGSGKREWLTTQGAYTDLPEEILNKRF